MVEPLPTVLEASVGDNSGQLFYNYPIAVPPGPDGFVPQLNLAYSSQATDERHDARSPAGAAGDGWSLSLGSITAQQYPSSSAGGSLTHYSLSNNFNNVADRLVPGANPDSYVTQHISSLRITFTNNCFHIWSLDGYYYELGCTADSLQYSTDANNNKIPYRYDVNRIVAPYEDSGHVRLILVSYLQDQQGNTIRDSALKQIQYGLATSPSATALSTVAGTVDLSYHGATTVTRTTGGFWVQAYPDKNTCANTPALLRCDDTQAVNGVPAPSVMSTFELDSITSYVNDDSTPARTAYMYQLSYQNELPSPGYTDPLTGQQEGAAGHHMLASITPTTFINGTGFPLKPTQFGYTLLTDTYYDGSQQPNGLPAYQMSTSWPYLTNYLNLDTGIGSSVTYATAYSNTRGTPYVINSDGTFDDRHNPLYCTRHANDGTSSTQCSGVYAHPDTLAWSTQVVTQMQSHGTDSSDLTPAATTYNYQLGVVTQTNGSCNPISVSSPPSQQDCVTDVWVPQQAGTADADWQDYYHGQFVGFNVVYVSSPAGNLDANYYYTTSGWATPATDPANYNAGQLYQKDVYQGNKVADSALLRRTTNTLAGTQNNQSSCKKPALARDRIQIIGACTLEQYRQYIERDSAIQRRCQEISLPESGYVL